MDKIVKISVLAALALASSTIHAFGLGEITVNSKLGEPLQAEIQVLDDADNYNELLIVLASSRDFQRVGLEKSAFLNDLLFEVTDSDSGEKLIRVSSKSAAKEPFISFLLEVNWASGRMLKEYTLLLDPPVFTAAPAPRPAPVSQADTTIVEAEPEPVQIIEESEPVYVESPEEYVEPAPVEVFEDEEPVEEAVTELEPAVDSEFEESPVYSSSSAYDYTVQAGDTLWEIARDQRPDAGVSVNEMMMALLETNPDAFFQNNINALKKGAVLRVPARDEIDNLAINSALAAVREQNTLWKQYQGQMAEDVPTVSEASSYYDSAYDEEEPEAEESRLQLVPPRETDNVEAATGNTSGETENNTALKEELYRAQEESVAKDQENAELSSRVSELEALVDKLERAINIKDTDLAELQAQLESSRQALNDAMENASEMAETGIDETFAEDALDQTETVIEETAEQVAEEVISEDTELEGLVEDSDDAVSDEELVQEGEFSFDAEPMMEEASNGMADQTSDEMASEEISEAEDAVESSEPDTQNVSTPLATEQSQSGPFGLSWPLLGGIGAAVLGLIGFIVVRVRKKAADEESILDLDELSESEEASLDNETESDEETDTAEIDPTNEAGHSELDLEDHAELDAESPPPLSGDESVTEAVEPVISLDEEGDDDLDLSDLYEEADGKASDLTSPEQADDDFKLETEPEASEENTADDDDLDFESLYGETQESESESESDDSFDFELDDSSEDADDDFDFDLDDLEPESADAVEADSLTEEKPTEDEPVFDLEVSSEMESVADDADISFDLDDLDDDSAVQAEDVPEAMPELEEEELAVSTEETEDELEIQTDDLFSNEDSVGTKLDLARAYIDMGDPDGARTMLEEVKQEGNDEQKDQADKLMDSLD